MSTEAATGLTFLPAGASQPDIIYAEMVRFIAGSGYRPRAQDKDLNTPPAHTAGNIYIVGPAPTGAWASRAGQVAYSDGTSWWFFTPSEGWELPVLDENINYRNDGSGGHAAWVSAASSFTGGSLTSAMNEAKGADIASAATTNIAAATGNFVHVTGTTAITALGTAQAGTRRIVRFAGILTLTHNATSLILPTGANITTAANDAAVFVSEGSGNWRCVGYQRADGTALAGSGGGGSLTDGDKGDITVSSSGAAWAIDNDAVTYAKMQNVSAASKLIGRGDSGSGDPQEITVGSGLTMTGTTLSATGGASLSNWTEAVNTSAPNATIPVASFTATNGATDVDAAIIAKGNGATVAQVADSGTTGGNKRGTKATDWQKQRSAATNVASGSYSVIGGGRSNTSSNNYSTVAGGIDGVCSGEYGFIGGGSTVTASGQYSVTVGGNSTQATAQYAATVGGNGNVSSAVGAFAGGGGSNAANGQYSWIAGGNNATARSIYGVGARASGVFAAQGDAQHREGTLRCSTTNATQTTLTTDGAAASTSNQLVLPNSSAFIVKAIVVSRENATGDTQSWEFTAHIKRGANAAATAMVAVCTPVAIAGSTAWALAVDADTTNGCLRIRFTGEAAKTIRTVCDVYSCCEVAG